MQKKNRFNYIKYNVVKSQLYQIYIYIYIALKKNEETTLYVYGSHAIPTDYKPKLQDII